MHFLNDIQTYLLELVFVFFYLEDKGYIVSSNIKEYSYFETRIE